MKRGPMRRLPPLRLVLVRLGIALVVTGAVLVSRPAAVARSFSADPGTLGAIPDYPPGQVACHLPGVPVPKDVTFTVSGIPGTVESVIVAIVFSPTHAFVGDLSVTLIAPGSGPSHVLFARTGATTETGFGDSSNLDSQYTFTDGPWAGWWQAAAAAGNGAIVPNDFYRTTAAGGAGQIDPAPATIMNAAFEGVLPNGIWTLRITDGCAGATGGVSSASLSLFTAHAPLDFDGNGATDFAVVRLSPGAMTWYWDNSLGFSAAVWGLPGDRVVPADYDGDSKDDLAVWRPGIPSAFYVRRSTDLSLFGLPFGQLGDDPSVVGDYDGDGKADPAVFRPGGGAGAPSYWYAWRSTNSTLLAQQWGQSGDTPAPGDYNGDGRHDFMVRRDAGGGAAVFYLRLAGNLGSGSVFWGTPSDTLVPGDYDGDSRTNLAVVRNIGGVLYWYVQSTTGGLLIARAFGIAGTDWPAQGDYDNDGVTDIAVWRSSATPGQCAFYVLTSGSDFTVSGVKQWGLLDDYPVANFNVH